MTVMAKNFALLTTLVIICFQSDIFAQVTTPVRGGSQRSSVCQTMGLVNVCVEYGSPSVKTKDGRDRSGNIWGGVVRYGWNQERWLEREDEETTLKPWRAGANENTTLEVSHDVSVEGKNIPAGKYGLFFIPGETEWELILSKDAGSWGHYSYEPSRDALRVTVKPETSDYREWMTYEFIERNPDRVVLALSWENLRIPIRIVVADIHKAYIDRIKSELQSSKLFYWYNWYEAAKYCFDNKVELELGLLWVEKAIRQSWVGNANFSTLKLKADLLHAMDRKAEADSVMQVAIHYAGGRLNFTTTDVSSCKRGKSTTLYLCSK